MVTAVFRQFSSLNLLTSIFALMTLTGGPAMAEAPAFEGMCRQKAKEVAAESYRGCITENRKVQIEQLKNDYQSKLKSLKDEYEGEINKMSGGKRTPETRYEAKPDATSYAAPLAAEPAPKKSRSRSSARASTLRSLPTKAHNIEEMTVRLRSSRSDDSSMDIPEPIPVESQPTDSDSGI